MSFLRKSVFYRMSKKWKPEKLWPTPFGVVPLIGVPKKFSFFAKKCYFWPFFGYFFWSIFEKLVFGSAYVVFLNLFTCIFQLPKESGQKSENWPSYRPKKSKIALKSWNFGSLEGQNCQFFGTQISGTTPNVDAHNFSNFYFFDMK